MFVLAALPSNIYISAAVNEAVVSMPSSRSSEVATVKYPVFRLPHAHRKSHRQALQLYLPSQQARLFHRTHLLRPRSGISHAVIAEAT